MPKPGDYARAHAYLAPAASSLWRWDEAREAVEWPDGQTIAFRKELEVVVARLAGRGLPPLGAIVLLLAACRANWGAESNRLGSLAGFLATIERREFPEWLGPLVEQLDGVNALPPDLLSEASAKADLAEMVFDKCRLRGSVDEAESVLRALNGPMGVELLSPRIGRQPLQAVLREWRCLHEGLARVDPERLRMRRRTGMEQLVLPAEVDVPPCEQARRLIGQCQDDVELGGVARVARQLLAAVHLPRGLAEHEDLPVGGVSDISNRGPLDRLLLSELAHDDLTLAVRVAMNEALYLRRESPPRNPPKRRAVLLDAGIRLWGVPRVFATAVGLSLAATADRRIEVDVFRAAGAAVAAVAITRREGLLEHLEALEPDAHVGDALPAFWEAIDANTSLHDAVVVTSEEAAADAEFQTAMAAADCPAFWLATVARSGRFRLVLHSRCGVRPLREAQLELDRLLAPAPRATPLRRGLPNEWPAILDLRPFPLLLSHQPLDFRRAWSLGGEGALSISRDGCLWHWSDAKRGARLLSDRAPRGIVHWAAARPVESTWLAAVGQLQDRRLDLLHVDLEAGDCRSNRLDLTGDVPLGVCGHGGAVFVVYADKIDAYEAAGGLLLRSIAMPHGIQWRNGRYFSGANTWYALAYDGATPRLERVSVVLKHLPQKWLAVLDGPTGVGPVAVTSAGQLHDIGTGDVVQVDHGLRGPLRVRAIARDGSRVVLAGNADPLVRMAAVGVADGKVEHCYGDPAWHAEAAAHKVFRPQSITRRFRNAYVEGGSQLTLARHSGRAVHIELDDAGREMLLRPWTPPSSERPLCAEFEPCPVPDGVGYQLQVARWGDGSRAFLDSRGLLHLKSADTTIPELTLVLREGLASGWCSDGRWFGAEYFRGEHRATLGAAIFNEVLRPFLARLW